MIQTLTTERTNQSSPQLPEWTVDEFLAMVSHELRNPITAILGWVDVISMNTADSETCAHAIEVIKRGALLDRKVVARASAQLEKRKERDHAAYVTRQAGDSTNAVLLSVVLKDNNQATIVNSGDSAQ